MPEIVYPLRAYHGAGVKVLVRSRGGTHIEGLLPVTKPLAAYLDTGASVTVLDPGVIRWLGLEAVGEAGLHVLGRDEVSFHAAYEVEIGLATGTGPQDWVPVTALEGTINPKGTAAALGRDFLAHFHLHYDGPAGRFTLRW